MHRFTSEWKCDGPACDKEVLARDQSRPKGWMSIDFLMNHANPPMETFDFCSGECLRAWRFEHNFEVKE